MAKIQSISHKTQKKEIPASNFLFVAFLEGAVVLSVEILGAKMLTPYFGTSLIVWTSVIAVTLTALTGGYYLGGYLSQKKLPENILFKVLMLAGVLTAFMPLFVYPLINTFKGMDIHIGSIFAAIFLLGPPLVSLGTTSPLIIQSVTGKVGDAGKFAGFVYAISTIGGIIMTFSLGFFIIPNFGIAKPILIIALLLIAVTQSLFYDKTRLKSTIWFSVFFLFIAFLVLYEKSPKKNAKITIPYVSEGLLGQLKVLDKIDEASGYPLRHLLINGIAQTRIINDQRDISFWKYIHKLSIYSSLKHGSQSVLLFGFGAGSVANEMNRLKQRVDAVEIDERMLDISKNYFYFNDSTTRFIVDDARHYIKTCTKKYDLLVFDIANGEIQPSYVFTTESFSEMKKIMNPGAIIVIEFQELLSKPKKIWAYKSIYKTLRASGFYTYYTTDDQKSLTDILLIASGEKIDFTKLIKENMTECCKMQPWLPPLLQEPAITIPDNEVKKDYYVFSDDQPLLDHINTESIKMWRENMLNYLMKTELDEGKKLFK